jgi:hypothetical protein
MYMCVCLGKLDDLGETITDESEFDPLVQWETLSLARVRARLEGNRKVPEIFAYFKLKKTTIEAIIEEIITLTKHSDADSPNWFLEVSIRHDAAMKLLLAGLRAEDAEGDVVDDSEDGEEVEAV